MGFYEGIIPPLRYPSRKYVEKLRKGLRELDTSTGIGTIQERVVHIGVARI